MEDIRSILKTNGIQITRQRLEVYQVLCELHTHVTAEMVLEVLQQRGLSMTVATVYNVLNLFAQKGLITKVPEAGEPVIYDINTREHIHICDEATRHVRDCLDTKLMELIRDYLGEHPIENFDLKRIDVSLVGEDGLAHSSIENREI